MKKRGKKLIERCPFRGLSANWPYPVGLLIVCPHPNPGRRQTGPHWHGCWISRPLSMQGERFFYFSLFIFQFGHEPGSTSHLSLRVSVSPWCWFWSLPSSAGPLQNSNSGGAWSVQVYYVHGEPPLLLNFLFFHFLFSPLWKSCSLIWSFFSRSRNAYKHN